MNRRIFSMAFMFAIFAALSLLFTACPSDSTGPSIYFLAKDGVTIDKKGDTTILLYTKYVDPGCYVEDNASISDAIEITSDLESVLPVEKKVASHIGEVKKTGEYKITYTATDEAGNIGQRSKLITCKNVSDIYTGKYWTVRDSIIGMGDICLPAKYYSNVTASNNVAGRIRFSKVAQHVYNGQKVSFKVDADLYSKSLSPRTRSDQVGYLGTASDKEVVFYNGLSYDAAVDSVRLNYVYLQIPTQLESVAYTESDAEISDYTVIIQGQLDSDRVTPKSKIVYNERGVMLYIELQLSITVNNYAVQNYVERYYPE